MMFMRWPEFAAALLTSAIALAFHVVPGAWCESPNVRGIAAIFVYSSPSAGFALGALVGGILGYIGIHWAKYVQF